MLKIAPLIPIRANRSILRVPSIPSIFNYVLLRSWRTKSNAIFIAEPKFHEVPKHLHSRSSHIRLQWIVKLFESSLTDLRLHYQIIVRVSCRTYTLVYLHFIDIFKSLLYICFFFIKSEYTSMILYFNKKHYLIKNILFLFLIPMLYFFL